VPAVAYKDPNNYEASGRLAQEMENAIWANQFDNLANRRAHYETTGAEIWEQTEGKVMLGNIYRDWWHPGCVYVPQRKNPAIKTVLADPMGSALYSYVKTGEIKGGSSITEGIGNSRVTARGCPD